MSVSSLRNQFESNQISSSEEKKTSTSHLNDFKSFNINVSGKSKEYEELVKTLEEKIKQQSKVLESKKTIYVNALNVAKEKRNQFLELSTIVEEKEIEIKAITKQKEDIELIIKKNEKELQEKLSNIDIKLKKLEDYSDFTVKEKLFKAVFENKLSIIEEVSKTNLSLNILNSEGSTALHVAAGNGYVDCVRLLIQKNADINKQDREGNSALHCAALSEYFDVVKVLVGNGADINLVNNDGLKAADYSSTEEILSLLMSHSDIFKAVENGNYGEVEKCLKQGGSVNVLNDDGMSPLHVATNNGSIEIVCLLIQHKAQVNQTDKEGNTPLHLAALGENEEIVKKLLSSTAKKDLKNKDGTLPIELTSTDEIIALLSL